MVDSLSMLRRPQWVGWIVETNVDEALSTEFAEQSEWLFVLCRSADTPDFAHRLQCRRRGSDLYQFLSTGKLRSKKRGVNEEV